MVSNASNNHLGKANQNFKLKIPEITGDKNEIMILYQKEDENGNRY